MKFDQLILRELKSFIVENNFQLIEQRDNYIKFELKHIVIIVSHNPFEKSNTLWIGKATDALHAVEIDNVTLEKFFKSSLQLSQVSIEIFIKNLVMFFKNECKPLLISDESRVNNLIEYDLERSRIYTQKLIEMQSLSDIDEAWDKNNYSEFIKLMDQIDKDKLPSSYQLKYKIAFNFQLRTSKKY